MVIAIVVGATIVVALFSYILCKSAKIADDRMEEILNEELA